MAKKSGLILIERNKLITVINISRIILFLIVVILLPFQSHQVKKVDNENLYEQQINKIRSEKLNKAGEVEAANAIKEKIHKKELQTQVKKSEELKENIRETGMLIKIGIAIGVYALLLIILPFNRIKFKPLGYLIALIDTIFIFLLIAYTGAVSSPFFVLLFFPLINISILYEIKGALVALAVYAAYYIYTLSLKSTQPSEAFIILVRMCLLSLFGIYLGSVGKEIKGKRLIKELKARLEIYEKETEI